MMQWGRGVERAQSWKRDPFIQHNKVKLKTGSSAENRKSHSLHSWPLVRTRVHSLVWCGVLGMDAALPVHLVRHKAVPRDIRFVAHGAEVEW
jgi:hypothetical protein